MLKYGVDIGVFHQVKRFIRRIKSIIRRKRIIISILDELVYNNIHRIIYKYL
jgi:hypothetical protein